VVWDFFVIKEKTDKSLIRLNNYSNIKRQIWGCYSNEKSVLPWKRHSMSLLKHMYPPTKLQQCHYWECHNMKPHHRENFKSYLLKNAACYCTFLTRVVHMFLFKKWHITFHLCYASDYTRNALIGFFMVASSTHKGANKDKKLEESNSEFSHVHSRKVTANIYH
jgi:hypothetical protein